MSVGVSCQWVPCQWVCHVSGCAMSCVLNVSKKRSGIAASYSCV